MMSFPRLLEEPLGADAAERPDFSAVQALWAQARRQPVPDYDGEVLRDFLRRRHARR